MTPSTLHGIRELLEKLRSNVFKVIFYAGAQALVQSANIATGFIIVRTMAKQEYAWFTIINGSIATVSILADSGLGSAFTSLGGKVFPNSEILASLAKLVSRMRLTFFAVAASLVVPLTAWALLKNKASPWIVASLCLMLVLAVIASTNSVVLMTINKLFSRVGNLIVADLTFSLAKLQLTAIACFVGLTAVGATACMVAGFWLQLLLLKHQTNRLLGKPVVPVDKYRADIRRTVVHILPICVFTCFQAQLAPFLLTGFAGAAEVADLGALARLAVVFTFASIPFAQIAFPAIARCQSPELLVIRIWQFVALLFAIVATVQVATYVFADYLLLILGPKYSSLRYELFVFMSIASLGFMANSLWSLAFSRSWVRNGWVSIPITLLLQATAAPMLDLNKVSSVIAFSGIGNAVSLAIACWLIVSGYRSEFVRC